MDLLTIANIFSVRKGYIYKYYGTYANQDPAITVTENLSILLKKNDFISSVIQIQGTVYVYINEAFPEGVESPSFLFLGNVEDAIEEHNRNQEDYLRSLEPPEPEPTPEPEPEPTPEPEPEPTPVPEPTPEPEEPQNAS